MSTATKREYERRIIEVNLGPRMRPSDTIADVTEIITPDDIDIESIIWTGGVCSFIVSGGAAGEKYPIIIRFTTEGTPAQRLEAEIELQVR